MDTAALVDRMVDCFNRHDAETLPATGRATDITGVVVLEVAGGRLTAERHYWPLVDGLMQLGLIGPPGHVVGQHPAHEALTKSIQGSCSISFDSSSCLPCLIIG